MRQLNEQRAQHIRHAMSTLRRHPKILYNHQDEGPGGNSLAFARLMKLTKLDANDALELLRQAENQMYVEGPAMVTQRYLQLDWSVLPHRAAQALWVILDEMHKQGSRRVIIPETKLAQRMDEARIQGWKIRSQKTPDHKTAGRALRTLHQLGYLDEHKVGIKGKNKWSVYYRAEHPPTAVELCSHPENATTKVRGHVRPSVWSVSLADHLITHLDIQPLTQPLTPSKPKPLKVKPFTGGKTVMGIERSPEDRPLTLAELVNYDEDAHRMTRAQAWLQEHGNLRGFKP